MKKILPPFQHVTCPPIKATRPLRPVSVGDVGGGLAVLAIALLIYIVFAVAEGCFCVTVVFIDR